MPDTDRPSLYALLGVAPDASQPELMRAYRRRARELHPDVAPAAGADESFTALTQAYRLLSDPARRSAYDATLRDPNPPSSPDAIPVPIRHVRPGPPEPPLRPSTIRGRRPPIVAGPTHVSPIDPEATR